MLQYAIQLDIRQVSVFAFSIENFKRNNHEVEYLMNLAKEGLMEIAQNSKWLDGKGV